MEEFTLIWVFKTAILSEDRDMGQGRMVNIEGAMREFNK